MEWLEQQTDVSGDHETADTAALKLLETIKINHIKRSSTLDTKFSVSQSTSFIAVASPYAKPSLSVIFPGTDKPPLIMSRDNRYISPFFVTISDKEYLAVSSRDGIHLWNLEKNALSVAYNFKEEREWHLCVIDQRTIACAARESASDGFSKIYVLNTDTEKFSLSSTLQLKIEGITDISYVKTTDGTSCLLLYTRYRPIQCVEMVGGRVRWQVDKQQMGEFFYPWSVCTDGSTVFVTDAVQIQLHLLSVEDGSVLTPINLRPFGIRFPSCVRVQGENVYLGHLDEARDTNCISKFTQPTAI